MNAHELKISKRAERFKSSIATVSPTHSGVDLKVNIRSQVILLLLYVCGTKRAQLVSIWLQIHIKELLLPKVIKWKQLHLIFVVLLAEFKVEGYSLLLKFP